jgi:hypothetical protein
MNAGMGLEYGGLLGLVVHSYSGLHRERGRGHVYQNCLRETQQGQIPPHLTPLWGEISPQTRNLMGEFPTGIQGMVPH